MKEISLGPVANSDGSPTQTTIDMLRSTGRDPEAFAASVERGRAIMAGYDGPADGIVGDDDTRDEPMTGDEAAEAGFVPGVDFVTCDICDKVEFFTEGVPDWNGETGAHLSCESDEEPSFYSMDLDRDNVGDLLLNVASTTSPTLAAGLASVRGDTPLVGIVSHEDGGIIAYALGQEHADLIVTALRSVSPYPAGYRRSGDPLPPDGDCAYCGAILTPGVEQVCREQGGSPEGTWVCSEGSGLRDEAGL